MCDRMLCPNMQPAIILDIYMITYKLTDHIVNIHMYPHEIGMHSVIEATQWI